MSIPALPPVAESGTPAVDRRPGSRASRLTGAIADVAGTGIVIPLNQVDEAGVDWRMQGLEGWDSAELEERGENKTGADGMWDAPNFFGPRIITISGLLTAPTYEAREIAEEQLRQAVPARRLVQVRIDETVPKYVMGRRSGRLMTTPLNEVHSKWSAAVFAPDPRKYGTTLRSADLALPDPEGGLAPPWTPPILIPARAGSETTTVTNAGAYETPPVIRLFGPGGDLGIANLTTRQVLIFAGAFTVGRTLIIDVAAGTALLDGTAPRSPLPGSALISEFFLVPGENRLQMLGTRTDAATAATATITWRDAWM